MSASFTGDNHRNQLNDWYLTSNLIEVFQSILTYIGFPTSIWWGRSVMEIWRDMEGLAMRWDRRHWIGCVHKALRYARSIVLDYDDAVTSFDFPFLRFISSVILKYQALCSTTHIFLSQKGVLSKSRFPWADKRSFLFGCRVEYHRGTGIHRQRERINDW